MGGPPMSFVKPEFTGGPPVPRNAGMMLSDETPALHLRRDGIALHLRLLCRHIDLELSASVVLEPALSLLIPILVTLVLPIVWIKTRRQRRIQTHFCGKCGYDLRNLKSRRCPECGRFVPWLPLLNRPKVKFYRQ